MKKRTKRILVGASAAVTAVGAGAVLASNKITKKLVGIAMDRERSGDLEKARKQMSKSTAEDRALYHEFEQMAEKLEHICTEQIEITARDGIKLVGHWYPCENAKRIIIAFHGWRSNWSRDFAVISDFWHDSGCSVLYAEQRGQNDSEGDYIGFGMLERLDCLDWIAWISEHHGRILPLYLAGVSMGATTVLMASEFEFHPPVVNGIIADCGFTSAHDIWEHVVKNNLHIPYRAAYADRLCRDRIELGTKSCSTIEALKHCSVPVLFIHGTADQFVPVEMTYQNYEACNSSKRLLIVDGATHGMSYHENKDGYEKALLEFWEEFDIPAENTKF